MRESIVLILGLAIMIALGGAADAGCNRSGPEEGCDDCGYFPSTQTWDCAEVQRNAFCSCSTEGMSNGCDLGSEMCDYSGENDESKCIQPGECVAHP